MESFSHGNKIPIYFVVVLFVAFFLFGNSVSAQESDDPCLEGGHELTTSFTAETCLDAKNGTAVVASTGCSCVFSGCTFLWSDGQTFHTATDLEPGDYSVTVTHPDSCVMVTNVIVTGAENFIQDVQAYPISCPENLDGVAIVIPESNAGLLEFAWSTGDSLSVVNGLEPGDYTVTITNFVGCDYVQTVTVTSPTAPEFDVSTEPACFGNNNGVALIEVSGGIPPFSYRWNDPAGCEESSAVNLLAGSYTVTVTDGNDCNYIYEDILVHETSTEVFAESNTSEACSGSIIQLSASGGSSYSWTPTEGLSNPNIANPTALVSSNISYEVEVINDEGCSNSASVSISTLPSPNPFVSILNPIICSGESTQLIAVDPSAPQYEWVPAEGLSNAFINAPIASPEVTTTYTLFATNGIGCTIETEVTVEVSVCSAVGDIALDEAFQIYPNPSNGLFSVQFDQQIQDETTLKIFNTVGQELYAQNLNSLNTQIDLSSFSKGLYLIQLETENGVSLKKVMLH